MKKLLLILTIFAKSVAYGQTAFPLTVGDKVPDIYFPKMLNHSQTSGHLSDFKGKAIIIDMWFKDCLPCVGSMPRMDSLQKMFKNDLQVLLLTWQDKKQIEEFWATSKNVGELRFTQVVNDTIGRTYFPAVSFPHQVWIGKDGRVKAITDGEFTNKENVQKLIIGDPINLAIKQDELDPWVHHGLAPLISIRYKEQKGAVKFYSYLSEFRKEFIGQAALEVDTPLNQVRIKFTNMDYNLMYFYAYNNDFSTPYYPAASIVRTDHNPLMKKHDIKNWTNSFCYDLIYNDSTTANFGKFMVPDLDRGLGFRSHAEVRKVLSYVISPNGKGTRYLHPLEPDKKPYNSNMTYKIGKELAFNKMRVDGFLTTVLYRLDKPLIIDMAKDSRLNFKVLWDLSDLRRMNAELEKYDLQIGLEERGINVVVLEDPL